MGGYRYPPRVDPAASMLVMLGVLVLVGVALIWWGSSEPIERPSEGLPPSDSRFHQNDEAGYELRYPRGWLVTERGSVTRLTRPDRKVIVTVGIGAGGSLHHASESLVSSLRASYSNVRLSDVAPDFVFGNRSLVVGGTVTNERGQTLRVLAITIETDEENYALTVFVPGDARPSDVLPQIRRIVESIRPPD